MFIKSVCLMRSGSKLQSSGVATGKHSRSVFITKIILMMFVLSFQENEHFNSFIQKLSSESHLVSVDGSLDVAQIFLVVDNEVLLEMSFYTEALFSICAIHHVFNIEYPKPLKMCFIFLEEYVWHFTNKKVCAIQERSNETCWIDQLAASCMSHCQSCPQRPLFFWSAP